MRVAEIQKSNPFIIRPVPMPTQTPQGQISCQPLRNEISFTGYNSPLKDLYKQGLMPEVKKGFYGDILTKDNVSLEHLKPHSKGGPTVMWNLVLASRDKNSARGNAPLTKYFNADTAKEYLEQFIGMVIPYKKGDCNKVFDGTRYAKDVMKTVKKLGGNIDLKI